MSPETHVKIWPRFGVHGSVEPTSAVPPSRLGEQPQGATQR